MTVSTENALGHVHEGSRSERRERELLVELIFRPLGSLFVRLLRPLGVPPPAVVLANAAVGLAAAVVLGRGGLLAAALLLQLKTLLDNTDGQLARASGRVTLVGRYLDTEADIVVNAVLFAALGSVTRQPWLALAAFVALTLVLSADFNADVLYRSVRGRIDALPTRSASSYETALEWVYRLVFTPQDRLVRTVVSRRFERISSSESDSALERTAVLSYHDLATVTVLANLGLSTQLVVLGMCLLAGEPVVYLWFVVACAALLPLLQLRREHLARRSLRR
jgi:archaetidylinositol phosphate synthase